MKELRATVNLARLLRDNNKRRDEARTMLTEIYDWFTEGFDTHSAATAGAPFAPACRGTPRVDVSTTAG